MAAEALNDIVQFARKNSPFYADLYAGLPEIIEDVSELPIVDHADYCAANTLGDNRLLTGPLTEAVVFKSGGTTDAPKFSYFTRDEWDDLAAELGRGLVGMGLRDGHRVANLFYVGELYASFFMFQDSLTKVPVETVRLPIGGATPPATAARFLAEFSANVIGGTPTTLCAVASELVAQGRALPCVEIVFFAGEPVFADQHRLLRQAFPGAQVHAAAYVSVDAGQLGLPVPGEDQRVYRIPERGAILEIVDDETGETTRENGRSGRIVKTDLSRRLQPVLRYPAGDRGEWLDVEAGLFRILGRHDEGARIGPVSVYTEDLRDLVNAADDAGAIIGMQLVASRWLGRDGLILRLAAQPGFAETAALGAAVIEKINDSRPMYAESVAAGYIHPVTVEWRDYGDFAVNRRTGKQLRVVDERSAS
jgi:phenylacetate-CoA ligase